MTVPLEGSRVSYVGEDPDIDVGDRGKVLAVAGPTASHVAWHTGKRAGQVTLTYHADLVSEREEQVSDGGMVSLAVRTAYQRDGTVGMLNALGIEGHLVAFPRIAEEAARFVADQVRQDPSIQRAVAHLGPDEAAELVSLATVSLLRDAFSEEP